LRGTADSDSLVAGAGNDKLFGFAGSDMLSGAGGDDPLNGGTDNDVLVGGDGKDILLDYDGGDVMTGGAGADQFWSTAFDVPDTPMVITDFEVGEDLLKIGRLGMTFEQLSIQDTPSGALIYESGHLLAVLSGVDAAKLTADSFIFGSPEAAELLQSSLEGAIQTSGAPGATNAIMVDGFTWKGAAGVSDLANQTPMQPDDVFSIASTTKAFTAATVLKVVEDGTLSLDDTLQKWLPEIAENLPYAANATLRTLLNGSSGIPDFQSNPKFQEDGRANLIKDKTPVELVTYAYGLPQFSGNLSTPTWTYTNTTDLIAGLMVEKATGTPFDQVMRAKIFEQLGLDHTSYGGKEAIVGNLVRNYSLDSNGKPEDITERDVPLISAYGAAGAVFSNVQDVARFTQALFGGELLTTESLNELVTSVDTGGIPNIPRYGLGIIDATGSSDQKIWALKGDSLGTESATLYLPGESEVLSTALANLQANSQGRSTVAPVVNNVL
jgi:D-alanyl-D-alanine carboxypeptidase